MNTEYSETQIYEKDPRSLGIFFKTKTPRRLEVKINSKNKVCLVV